jgi:hypothetical protein
MKILLDECLPRKLKFELEGHEVYTVPQKGWAGIKNGALLQLAEMEFDVFITIDRNMPHQQNFRSLVLAVIVLVATSNQLEMLKPLVPEILRVLEKLQPGEIRYVGE